VVERDAQPSLHLAEPACGDDLADHRILHLPPAMHPLGETVVVVDEGEGGAGRDVVNDLVEPRQLAEDVLDLLEHQLGHARRDH
jgi:hypothetical protein